MVIHHNWSSITDEHGDIVNIGGIITHLTNIAHYAPNPMSSHHQITSQAISTMADKDN